MARIRCRFIFAASVLLAGLVDATAQDAKLEVPPPLVSFRFKTGVEKEGKGNASSELAKVEYKDNALYLNGIYELNSQPPGGFHAIFHTPELKMDFFSVGLRFRPEDLKGSKINLITAGRSHRWFGLERGPSGLLQVTFNNFQFRKEIKDARLETGQWQTVACSVDLPHKRVLVSFNGKKAVPVDLADDFELLALKLPTGQGDLNWSFANYATSAVFHGLVSELAVFDQALGALELAEVFRKP